jgi:dUTP pyrophosphatase
MKEITVICQVKNGFIPTYQSETASGADLYASIQEDLVIKPGERNIIPTGLSVQIPPGYEAQVRPRSGLAIKNGISILNTPGTIDSDYRGEIKIIVINLSKEDFTVKRGDRIAQIIFSPVVKANFERKVKLDPSERGSGGFGSTGI